MNTHEDRKQADQRKFTKDSKGVGGGKKKPAEQSVKKLDEERSHKSKS